MKLTTIKSVLNFSLLLGIFSLSTSLFSQESDYELIQETLTVQQREMLQQEKQIMLQNRKELRSSLTEEQIAIIQDKKLTQEQIRKRLRESFSAEQTQLVENQENRIRNMKQLFQNSLTEEQRNMLQQRIEQRIKNSGEQSELKGGTRTTNKGARPESNPKVGGR